MDNKKYLYELLKLKLSKELKDLIQKNSNNTFDKQNDIFTVCGIDTKYTIGNNDLKLDYELLQGEIDSFKKMIDNQDKINEYLSSNIEFMMNFNYEIKNIPQNIETEFDSAINKIKKIIPISAVTKSSAFTLFPMQRLLRYPLTIKEIIEHSKGDTDSINSLVKIFEDNISKINDSVVFETHKKYSLDEGIPKITKIL